MGEKTKVVIVGAGFGGLTLAKQLDSTCFEVTVIDRRNYHLFQPLLYQVATAGLSPANIAAPIRGVLRRQKNTKVLLATVTGVDLKKQEVIAGDYRVGFDYLVIATGARHSYFGHDEWERFAPGLKTIDDATEIRRRVLIAFEKAEVEQNAILRNAFLTFIIVGGGPTGVELAGAISELAHRALARDFRSMNPRSTRIILVEAGSRILPSFPEKLSKKAKESLKNLNVEVWESKRVESIAADGVWIDTEKIPAQTIIWAAGVRASPAGQWLGANTDRAGRVIVNPDLSVPGHPNVFVIGDTAFVVDPNDPERKPLPGVAPVAMQQGKYLGESLFRKVLGQPPVGPFVYKDKGSLATIGRSAAIADFGWLRLHGFIAWLIWGAVHIMYLISFRNRLLVLFEWAWAYITFQKGSRLITRVED